MATSSRLSSREWPLRPHHGRPTAEPRKQRSGGRCLKSCTMHKRRECRHGRKPPPRCPAHAPLDPPCPAPRPGSAGGAAPAAAVRVVGAGQGSAAGAAACARPAAARPPALASVNPTCLGGGGAGGRAGGRLPAAPLVSAAQAQAPPPASSVPAGPAERREAGAAAGGGRGVRGAAPRAAGAAGAGSAGDRGGPSYSGRRRRPTAWTELSRAVAATERLAQVGRLPAVGEGAKAQEEQGRGCCLQPGASLLLAQHAVPLPPVLL